MLTIDAEQNRRRRGWKEEKLSKWKYEEQAGMWQKSGREKEAARWKKLSVQSGKVIGLNELTCYTNQGLFNECSTLVSNMFYLS